MRTRRTLTLAIVCIMAVVCLLIHLHGAPVPQPQEKPVPKSLKEVDFSGQWKMGWGATSWDTLLKMNNDYRAEIPATVYSGSWWLDDGYFMIWESLTPEDPATYTTYRISLDPATLQGEIVEINAARNNGNRTKISFTRAK